MKSIISRLKIKAVFYTLIFIFGLSRANLFAGSDEVGKIQGPGDQEKQSAPESIIRPKIEYKAEDLRDSFAAPPEKKSEDIKKVAEPEVYRAPPPTLTTQGLIWGGNIPQAIINDKVVKVGDTIQGAKIISITKDGVTLLFEGMQYNLSSPAMSAGINKPKGGENDKNF